MFHFKKTVIGKKGKPVQGVEHSKSIKISFRIFDSRIFRFPKQKFISAKVGEIRKGE